MLDPAIDKKPFYFIFFTPLSSLWVVRSHINYNLFKIDVYHTAVHSSTCVASRLTRVNEENARSEMENKFASSMGKFERKNTKFIYWFHLYFFLHKICYCTTHFELRICPYCGNFSTQHCCLMWRNRGKNNPVIIYLHAAKITPTTMKCSLFIIKSIHVNTGRTHATDIIESTFIHFIFISHMSEKKSECIWVPKTCIQSAVEMFVSFFKI